MSTNKTRRYAIGFMVVSGLIVLGILAARRTRQSDSAEANGGSSSAQVAATSVKKSGSNESDSTTVSTTSAAKEPLPTLAGTKFRTDSKLIAPEPQTWPSEAFAEQASIILKKIKTAKTPEEWSSHFAADFQLRVPDSSPETLFEDSALRAYRVIAEPDELQNKAGQGAIDTFCRMLRPPECPTGDVRLLKIIRVSLNDDQATTRVRCESVGRRDDGCEVQQIQSWNCIWTTDGEPRLVRAELEQSDWAEATPPKMFADRTHDIVGHTESFRRQLRFGLQHWLARIETGHGMNYFSKHGLAVADVNGDGRDDLYVCQPAGLPNRLFLQQPDGTLQDVSAKYEVDLLDKTTAALFVDLDNDGDQDMALATIIGVQIYSNEKERFEHKITMQLNDIDLHGLTAVDYDNDGDLDLYQIVDYSTDDSRRRQGLPSFVYHNANDGGSNRLLRNDISDDRWLFADVTDMVGLDANNHRHSLAAAWEDVDDDGDLDLYVANDYGQNCLYRNDDGQFKEIADAAGVTDFGSGMSVSWGDYDRDGKVDLYVSNMFSSAGNRLTTQPQFLPQLTPERRRLYQRFAKGNSLFRNEGNGRFVETGNDLNVEMARWAWASLFVDVNNDGWDDLAVANGYITTDDTGDL